MKGILKALLLGLFLLSVFSFIMVKDFLGRYGFGGAWPYIITGMIMSSLIVVPLVIFAAFKINTERKDRIRVRANQIVREACPACAMTLVHHKGFGFYCEKCMKYID